MAIAVFMSSPFLRLYGLTQEEEQHPCRVASRPCQTPNGGRGGRFWSGNGQNSRWGRVGAVRRGIVGCCVGATLGLWSLVGGALAAAQEPAAVVAAEVGQPPSPDVSMKAYRAVEDWVRGWKVGDEAAPVCAAASVTLRMDGEVFGRGVAMGDKCIAAATKQAMAEAEPKLGVPRDALYQETLKDLAKRITISVQLAGELVPVVVKDAADAASSIAPGLEGAGARLGDRTAVMFPERMLTLGTEPGPALASLVGKLADDPALAVVPLSMLAKDHGAVFYRFKVSHVAQVKAGDSPRFLQRCGRVVPSDQIDTEGLKRWADKLAAALMSRGWAGPEKYGMAGTYEPIRGEFQPRFASAIEQGLSAFALWKYQSTLGLAGRTTPGVEPRVGDWLEAWARALAVVEPGEVDPAADAASAAVTVRLFDYLHVNPTYGAFAGTFKEFNEPDMMALKKRCVDKLTPIMKEGGSALPETERALVLFLGADQRHNIDPNPSAVSALYVQLGPAKLVAAMPWLGWADQQVHAKGELPAAVALREMRSMLWKHQLQDEDLPWDQKDLAGGIVFSTSSPVPSWQAARPLAFVASMLRDLQLTEDREVSEELLHLLASLRFLRQLTAGESECFMYRKPDQAIGGVRSSLWDQRMPPEATAMTLMAVCETLKSLDEIQKRGQKRD